MGASTSAGSDKTMNPCNIAYGHAYSVIAAFSLTATNGTVIPAMMIRNPWGTVSYNLSLSSSDAIWS